MPLPRYQPIKRQKISGPTINDLDDVCLAKIISYVLKFSSFKDDDSAAGDNVTAERNLSLVSKRWYFLTQTQISDNGILKIDLNNLIRQLSHNVNSNKLQSTRGRGAILTQRNIGIPSIGITDNKIQSSNEAYCIDLFRRIQPLLRKYKHIQMNGTLAVSEFKKILLAIGASRTVQLRFNLQIEKRLSRLDDLMTLPKNLPHIEELALYWTIDRKSCFSNDLTWRIYERATKLKVFELHTKGTNAQTGDNFYNLPLPDLKNPINQHHNLEKIVFTWTSSELMPRCPILSLIKNLLLSENSVAEIDTNDYDLVEYLINSSDRVCTTHILKRLKLLVPIRDTNLLTKLLQSSTLGTERLCIEIDDIDLMNEVRNSMDYFRPSRSESASCRLTFSIKDQKFSDCEDKIKMMVQLSRLADLVIKIEAQQRISIDCCHMMWSVGRSLQGKTTSDIIGKCLFRVIILGCNQNRSTNIEVTVPFGKCRNYSIDSTREDLNRHREIMKSLKKDCYHQFVKSVRGNLIT